MTTDTTHECPRPGCNERVPRERLACRSDWYALPRPLRNAISAAYRGPGPGSEPHRAALLEAIRYLEQSARGPEYPAPWSGPVNPEPDRRPNGGRWVTRASGPDWREPS